MYNIITMKSKTSKKSSRKSSKILKCDKYFSKNNKEQIIIDHITKLYNRIDKLCQNMNINFSKNVNLEKVINGTLDKLKHKKGKLQFLANALF